MAYCIKRCGNVAIVIPRLNDGFCKECFISHVVHKFRASIGKSKLIRDDENVLVAFSGGAASTCLLHLIKEGTSLRVHKRLRFKSSVVFIDETAFLDIADADRFEYLEHILTVLRTCHFPSYILSIEQSLHLLDTFHDSNASHCLHMSMVNDALTPTMIMQSNEDTTKFLNLLETTQSYTAKEDLLQQLRERLLVSVAEQINCTKIAMADCSNRLAVTFLSDIAGGRGAHVSDKMGFNNSNLDCQIFRPLKDFTSKEIVFYNRLNNLTCITIPTFTTKLNPKASINRLTEDFVNKLQSDYASTIPNITRTGEKIAMSSGNTDIRCRLCRNTIEKVTTSLPPPDASATSSVTGQHDHSTEEQMLLQTDCRDSLCYGCQITASEIDQSKLFLNSTQTTD